MLSAGPATEEIVATLDHILAPNEVMMDGGKSVYKDNIRFVTVLAEKGIHYIDVGTRGHLGS